MDLRRLELAVETSWDEEIIPSLSDYISIPCQSPAFDLDWQTNELLDAAAEHLATWAANKLADVEGARVEILKVEGRTPLIFASIPGEGEPILFYGHFDKQPPMDGWSSGRHAWSPSLEGDRLYGRGGADDGYAIYAAITALLAAREQKLPTRPCILIIEGSEESGSGDLYVYFELLRHRIGEPSLVIALDAGAPDYDTAWFTTSVRGQVAGNLRIRVLTQAIHSGDGAGVVPTPFRIARELLSRLEDELSGAILPDCFSAEIPHHLEAQARAVGALMGAKFTEAIPFADTVRPVSEHASELLLNRSWRPQLAVLGIDGLPGVAGAAAVIHPEITLRLSLRLPPSVDPAAAARSLKEILESEPPHGADVSFVPDMTSPGWHAQPLTPELHEAVSSACTASFGIGPGFFGGGGGIPFLRLLADSFPNSQLLLTGVLGPESNAHGPNEFLHLPTAKRLTTLIAQLITHVR